MFSALSISYLRQNNNVLFILTRILEKMTPNLVNIGDTMTPNSFSQGKTLICLPIHDAIGHFQVLHNVLPRKHMFTHSWRNWTTFSSTSQCFTLESICLPIHDAIGQHFQVLQGNAYKKYQWSILSILILKCISFSNDKKYIWILALKWWHNMGEPRFLQELCFVWRIL